MKLLSTYQSLTEGINQDVVKHAKNIAMLEKNAPNGELLFLLYDAVKVLKLDKHKMLKRYYGHDSFTDWEDIYWILTGDNIKEKEHFKENLTEASISEKDNFKFSITKYKDSSYNFHYEFSINNKLIEKRTVKSREKSEALIKLKENISKLLDKWS